MGCWNQNEESRTPPPSIHLCLRSKIISDCDRNSLFKNEFWSGEQKWDLSATKIHLTKIHRVFAINLIEITLSNLIISWWIRWLPWWSKGHRIRNCWNSGIVSIECGKPYHEYSKNCNSHCEDDTYLSCRSLPNRKNLTMLSLLYVLNPFIAIILASGFVNYTT